MRLAGFRGVRTTTKTDDQTRKHIDSCDNPEKYIIICNWINFEEIFFGILLGGVIIFLAKPCSLWLMHNFQRISDESNLDRYA